MDTREYARARRLHSREDAAILSIFDGIHQLAAEEVAEKCRSIFRIQMDTSSAKSMLDRLADDGLVDNTMNRGSTFMQKPGYKISWDGMRESTRLNPAEKAIEMVDSLCYPLSSDLKAFTILAMEPGRKYYPADLGAYIAGRLEGKVAIPPRALINYFSRWKDPVAPVKATQEHSMRGNVNWVSVQKEPWASYTYDPIIVDAMRAAVGLSHEFGRTVTLAEIFGPSSSPGEHSKGASVYAIINTLANSQRDYTYKGLQREIIGMFGIDARHEIYKLSRMGAIYYRSTYASAENGPHRIAGYIRRAPIDVEKAMDSVVELRPYLSKGMKSVRSTVEIAAESDGRLEPKEVAARSGCDLGSVSKVMSAMAKAGLLARWDDGSNENSVVRANRITHYLWREVFSHIGEMAWFMHTYGTESYSRAPESVAWAGRHAASSLEGELASNVIGMVGAYSLNKKEEMGLARRD